MKVGLTATLSDAHLEAARPHHQRQLAIAVSAIPDASSRTAPINLCLILDRSGSMNGRPLDMVKQAAMRLIDNLSVGDRLSVIAFDHKAQVLIRNQIMGDANSLKAAIQRLRANGGTAIDEGMRLGLEELAKGKQESISQAFLLTDGENEHGDNGRCLKLAELAAVRNLTLNTLGFGDHWNQDVLERIADAGGGSLRYIQRPEDAVDEFSRLFARIQSIGLTNAHLLMQLSPQVRLAELKPVAQVVPDTIELPVTQEAGQFLMRLGDLMVDAPRVALANLYVDSLPEGVQAIARLQIRYDNPAANQQNLLSAPLIVEAAVMKDYQTHLDPQVQQYILALAKYRQTQIAEAKMRQGDRQGAVTLLQSAARTALQMGDRNAATVLQSTATRLQEGKDLSEADRKKTRIVSKTMLQE